MYSLEKFGFSILGEWSELFGVLEPLPTLLTEVLTDNYNKAL